jgi:flagellar protein FliS
MDARLSYREAAVEGASPVRLVALLYEQAIEDLKRARAAIDRGDIEGRTHAINHAVVVIGYLQSSLDKQRGGRVAANLENFYNQLRARLVEAQFTQSGATLELQISHLVEVHSAWCEVERDVERAHAVPANANNVTQSALARSARAQSDLAQSGLPQSDLIQSDVTQSDPAQSREPERASAEWSA